MSISNDELLEFQKYSNNKVKKITLGQGWDEGDINSNIDFEVVFNDGREIVLFVVSIGMLDKFSKADGMYLLKKQSGYDIFAVLPEINKSTLEVLFSSLK